MDKGYKSLFWGLIIIIINIKFGNIYILTGFIGYIFIYFGLKELSKYEPSFELGKKFTNLMFIVCIINPFLRYVNANLEQITPQNIWRFVVLNTLSIVHVIIYYYICKGVYMQAEKREVDKIKKKAILTWNFKLYTSIASYISTAFWINLGEKISILQFVVYFFNFLANVQIIILVRNASRDIREV